MVMMVECSAMNNEIHPPSVPHPHHTSHIMQSSYTCRARAASESKKLALTRGNTIPSSMYFWREEK